MATAVVSGRVDERVKREVDRIIERAGKTPGDVVRDVWTAIYQTGELPQVPEEQSEIDKKQARFQDFMDFVHSAPPTPDWAVNLTDAEMNDMIAEGQLARWSDE